MTRVSIKFRLRTDLSVIMDAMKSAKPTLANGKPLRAAKAPSQQAIVRAVASSTAIETGKSIRQIEQSLLSKNPKLRKIALAR